MGPAYRYQYKQQCKEPHEGPVDKRFRHIAYRQFDRWCWGILGKQIRVVLPSRAVMCIRNFYPPPWPEEEFVFKGFKYADEWLTIDNTGRCLHHTCSYLPPIFKYWAEYAIPFNTYVFFRFLKGTARFPFIIGWFISEVSNHCNQISFWLTTESFEDFFHYLFLFVFQHTHYFTLP